MMLLVPGPGTEDSVTVTSAAVTVTVLDPVACCFKFDSYATIDLPED